MVKASVHESHRPRIGRDPRRAATTSGIASGATPAERGDLRALTGRVAELLTGPATAPIAATLLSAGVERPELAAVSSAFFGDRLTREQPVLERAARRGEPVADVDLRTVMDLLAGAVWFRVLVRGGAAPTGAELDEIVRTVLHGIGGRT